MTHSIVLAVIVLVALHAHFAVATLPHHGGAAWRSSLGGSAAAAQTTLRLRGAGPKGKNARGGKGPGKGGAKPSAKAPAKGKGSGDMKELADALPKVDEASIPVVTGCLESHPGSRDVKIGQFSLEIYGKPLVDDTTIELNFGRR
jgi:ATP-binding cassette subfamily F protein 2